MPGLQRVGVCHILSGLNTKTTCCSSLLFFGSDIIFYTQISLFVQVVTVLFSLFHSFCIPEDKLILGLFGEHGEVKVAPEFLRPLVNCSSCNISFLILMAEQTKFH